MFWLYDDYDGDEEFLGQFDTMSEVKAACRQRDIDTDGEWQPLLKKTKIQYAGNVGTKNLCVVYNWSY